MKAHYTLVAAIYDQSWKQHLYIQIGAMYNVLGKKIAAFFSSGFRPNIGIGFGL